MKLAVIVTTYNRPDALRAVLAGYAAQTDLAFELLVADDGSRDDTGDLVRRFTTSAPFPCHHVWHEDIGFRAAGIRNRALCRTTADYVVFTDGDCIPGEAFVARHRSLAEPGWFVAGNRVLLSRAFTDRVLAAGVPVHRWSGWDWMRARLAGDVNRLAPLLDLGDGGWRKRRPRQWEGVKTCNLGAWRTDLVAVNGLDETYTGWGMEDSDLVVRLLRAGVRHKTARFSAPVFHLWHPENDRSRLPENRARLAQVLASSQVQAALGLDRYAGLPEPESGGSSGACR